MRQLHFARKNLFRLFALVTVMALMNIAGRAQESLEPTGGQPWDLQIVPQSGQFAFYDSPAGASTTGKPLDAGDFDGNGCGDLAITGQNATHSVDGEWRGSAGHVRIVMNFCGIGGRMTADSLGSVYPGFTIYGAYSGDMAGTETYIADFNGDSFDDLLFSAQNSDGAFQNRSNAGAAYVLFGSPDFAQHADIDLRATNDDIIAFYGATEEDRFGLWVEGGDFDGDGLHDLLIGANEADGEGDHRINAGEAWVIYGSPQLPTLYGSVIDMREPPADATRIIGVDYDDLFGSTVWGDDLDGDGYDDAIISAALWRASSGIGGLSFGGGDGPDNRRYNSGETFIIFGRADLRGQTIDLAAHLDPDGRPTDDSISVVYGRYPNDLLGEEIAVGDMDGDGRNDLILGTLVGDGAERNLDEAGEAWVIYTHDPVRGQMFDMSAPEAGRTVVVYPDQADSKAGDTLRAADIDRDGVADLLYGAPDYDVVGYDGRVRHNAGMMAILFGEMGGLPAHDGEILLFAPPDNLRVRFIAGADNNDMMPYALAVYDLDTDSYRDIIPNAMGGDGENNDRVNAGEIYALSGREFMSPDHVYVGAAPSTNPTEAIAPTLAPTAIVLQMDATVVPDSSANIELGRQHFEETCAGCHGFQGEGVPSLGLPLVTSPLVLYASDADLLAFLRTGRAADHPDNVTGVSMPPSGGRPDWSDAEFADIIAYVRWLRDQP
ncbi:MAG: FG-GAP repeat protein [Anaerolineae bacterium]|nr:FG-GAP repeat protein [Anaerolineae bacterium]